MTDDPFKNRPEDLLNRAIKAGVGSLPVVGGPIAEFITFVIGEPAQERRDDFMRDIYGRIVDLEASHAEFKAETLRANEQFQATFIQAAQLSMRARFSKSDASRRTPWSADCIINTSESEFSVHTGVRFIAAGKSGGVGVR